MTLRVEIERESETTAMLCGSGMAGLRDLTWAADLERVRHCVAASLQQSQIAHYLLGLGLVNPRAVVEGDLTVVDRSQRNTVHVVTALGEPVHVVKQAGPD